MTLEDEINEEQARNDRLTRQITKLKALLPLNPADYEKMPLEGLAQDKKESDKRLAALKRRESGKTAKLIVWQGSKRAWGDMILGAHGAGFIQATSALNALEQAAEHFVWKDAERPDEPLEPFKPRSVWQSLKNRKDYQDPQKPGAR